MIPLIIQDQFYTIQKLQRFPIPQTSNLSGTSLFLSLLLQTLTFIAISEHLFMNIPLIFFRYKVTVLLLTFISYTCYHLARKAISVVKPKLVECPDDDNNTIPHQNETCTSWISKSCFIMYIYGVPH